MTADTLYLWVAVGDPSAPPQRLKVESCHDCGALVLLSEFDRHGQAHAAMERMAER